MPVPARSAKLWVAMAANPSKARYYLRCGLTELDTRGEPLQEHLGPVYGQWFILIGSRLPEDLREEWARIHQRMTSQEPIGASSRFESAAAMMTDDEAKAVAEDIAAIMVKLGRDADDPRR